MVSRLVRRIILSMNQSGDARQTIAPRPLRAQVVYKRFKFRSRRRLLDKTHRFPLGPLQNLLIAD
jgi:hypothetical protein